MGAAIPLYVARRVVRMAVEDIGLADPRALSLTLDAWEAYDRLGSPEGELAIAQAVVYLACAPEKQRGVRGDGGGRSRTWSSSAPWRCRRVFAMPHAADEGTGARRRAIATPTMNRTPTRPANAICPMSCRIGDTIAPRPGGWRSALARLWPACGIKKPMRKVRRD